MRTLPPITRTTLVVFVGVIALAGSRSLFNLPPWALVAGGALVLMIAVYVEWERQHDQSGSGDA